MGIVQKDAVRTSIISFVGIGLGYLNKAVLFVLLFSTAQVGLLNLLMSVGLLFAQFANLGTIYTTWRFFPFFRNPAKHHYGFLLANFLLVIVGCILFSGLLYLLKPDVVILYSAKSPLFLTYFTWIVPLGIALVIFHLFENYLRGMGQNVLPVLLQDIVLRFCVTILLIFFALHLLSFPWFVGLYVIIHFVPAIYLLIYLIRAKELKFSLKTIQIPIKFRRFILSYSGFSYVNSLANLLVISMDALMIAQLIGLEATGVYTTMLFLISAVVFPYRSIMRVATPLVAKLWKERNIEGLQELYQKSSSVGLLLGLFGFLGVWVVIDPLLSMVPAYQTGKWVFFILMLGRLIDMYFGLNGVIFSTSKKYKIDLIFTVCLIGSVYFANLWLIPILGIVGAAISTSSAYLLYNLLRGFYIQRHYRLFPYQLVQLKLFFLGIVVFFLFSLLAHLTANWWPMQPFTQIIVKEIVLLLVFILPIFIWNLEPETVGYVQSIWNKWRRKQL
jgi:O-antigen/teichoic acid export membrane protein